MTLLTSSFPAPFNELVSVWLQLSRYWSMCAQGGRRRLEARCKEMTSSPTSSMHPFIKWVKEKSKAEAQSSSKRQKNANIIVKAIKNNVRAFPKANGLIEREFKGVHKHSGSPCHTTDQWSSPLFMRSNWLAVQPHADIFEMWLIMVTKIGC